MEAPREENSTEKRRRHRIQSGWELFNDRLKSWYGMKPRCPTADGPPPASSPCPLPLRSSLLGLEVSDRFQLKRNATGPAKPSKTSQTRGARRRLKSGGATGRRRTRRTGEPHAGEIGRREKRESRAMLICGACERVLPKGAYSREQWARR